MPISKTFSRRGGVFSEIKLDTNLECVKIEYRLKEKTMMVCVFAQVDDYFLSERGSHRL